MDSHPALVLFGFLFVGALLVLLVVKTFQYWQRERIRKSWEVDRYIITNVKWPSGRRRKDVDK